MPGRLQVVVEHQPNMVMVDAVRALTRDPAAEAMIGHGAGSFVVRSLQWAAGIVAIFASGGGAVPARLTQWRRSTPRQGTSARVVRRSTFTPGWPT
jgi:hypothetical protein